jgi:hypothetical protein
MMLVSTQAVAGDLALGDSIALGTGRALGVHTVARVGASSCWIAAKAPAGRFDRVVVSAGINDPPGPCVGAIRKALEGRVGQVVFIVPARTSAATNVLAVAAEHGDSVVRYVAGRDRTHPQSYVAVARAVRAAWGR